MLMHQSNHSALPLGDAKSVYHQAKACIVCTVHHCGSVQQQVNPSLDLLQSHRQLGYRYIYSLPLPLFQSVIRSSKLTRQRQE